MIIKREYLVRVKKKSFILTTLLAPLAIGLLIVIVGLIFSYQGDDSREVVIIDQGNMLDRKMKDQRNFYFRFSDQSLEELVANKETAPFDGILIVPPLEEIQSKKLTIYYHSNENLDLDASDALQRAIRDKVRGFKINEMKLDADQLDRLSTQITLDPEPLTPSEDDDAASDNPSPFTP